jgi:hypothetical protein
MNRLKEHNDLLNGFAIATTLADRRRLENSRLARASPRDGTGWPYPDRLIQDNDLQPNRVEFGKMLPRRRCFVTMV